MSNPFDPRFADFGPGDPNRPAFYTRKWFLITMGVLVTIGVSGAVASASKNSAKGNAVAATPTVIPGGCPTGQYVAGRDRNGVPNCLSLADDTKLVTVPEHAPEAESGGDVIAPKWGSLNNKCEVGYWKATMRVENLGDFVSFASLTITATRNGKILATADGNVGNLAAGATKVVQFIGLGCYSGTASLQMQVDSSY